MAKRLEMGHIRCLSGIQGTEQVADRVPDRVSEELDFPADYVRNWMGNPIYHTQNIHDSGIGAYY